jgi:hypothetical protein
MPKLFLVAFATLTAVRSTAAFTVVRSPRTATTTLSASRRDTLTFTGTAVATALWGGERPAHADIDYARVQDLLGNVEATSPQSYAAPGARPKWLEEPTEDFKRNEQKATEFKRAALQRKQEFQAILDRFQEEPNDETILASDLDDLRRRVKQNGGLPQGISKEDTVKQIRRRKARKPRYWPTQVEIAYQDLVSEILYQQSPNTDRDMDNPM